ncbi:MAG: carbamoyl-phosphate synthase domain-containing protein, partial [Ilumatobacteraceae bacterium]
MSGTIRPGHLVLTDGSIFEGEIIGADVPISSGEVVFNTALSGYQEILTDPSYAGQIVTFTYPHIGNYGVNDADAESRSMFASGVIVRDLARRASNYRSQGHLAELLAREGRAGIAGVDTRRLTRILREQGSLNGAFGTAEVDELAAVAAGEPGTGGVDLVARVTCDSPYTFGEGPRRVVAYDFGIKTTILRSLARHATVEVVPAHTTAAEVLARQPDGV